LATLYEQAHRIKSISTLSRAELGGWIDGRTAAAISSLFKSLQLDEVRVIDMPPLEDPKWRDVVLQYVYCDARGDVHVNGMVNANLCARLELVGHRPDGTKVQINPGYGVFRVNDHVYFHAVVMPADTAKAVPVCEEAPCRMIPHGYYAEFHRWWKDRNVRWPETLQKVEELEQKAKLEEDRRAQQKQTEDGSR
jgi:hypothetical protein